MITMMHTGGPVDWTATLGVTLRADVPAYPEAAEDWNVASVIPGAIVDPWERPRPSHSEMDRLALAAGTALRGIIARTTVFAPAAASRSGAEGGSIIPHYGHHAGGSFLADTRRRK